jgi:hypothetical protein
MKSKATDVWSVNPWDNYEKQGVISSDTPENELFNKLEEIVCSAPIGGVKKDLTIKTLGEIFTDRAIKTLVSHLMKNGVEVK